VHVEHREFFLRLEVAGRQPYIDMPLRDELRSEIGVPDDGVGA